MKNSSLTDRTLALAGVCQAAALVNQVARRGNVAQPEFETAIRSLFVTEPENAESVFGSRLELDLGLRTLLEQMGDDQSRRDLYKTRYTIGMLLLERKLARRRDLLDYIGNELDKARLQLEHFSLTHTNVIARLADIYLNTISTLTPRIMVSGEGNHLQNEENANRVRALLLAGIRAAVLWHQCGGRRWHLLLKRRVILDEAKRLQA